MSKIDIAIISRAKQGYIYKHMKENNLTLVSLAKEIGISYGLMCNIINFKWLPGNRHRGAMEKLEQYFKLPIEYLFPPELTRQIADKLSRPHAKIHKIETMQLTQAPVKYLQYDPGDSGQPHILDRLPTVLNKLTPREKDVIEKRFGFNEEGKTRDQVAEEHGVSRERIWQIEDKALRKCRKQMQQIERKHDLPGGENEKQSNGI